MKCLILLVEIGRFVIATTTPNTNRIRSWPLLNVVVPLALTLQTLHNIKAVFPILPVLILALPVLTLEIVTTS